MNFAKVAALVALPLLMAAGASQAYAYDNDDQALRLRDIVADPSVPLAWDRRHHEGYSYGYSHRSRVYASDCGRRRYWDGDECVLKRRYR